MNIVFIGPFGFHPNKTMAVRALPLAKALVAQGHSVHLIMPPWQTPAEAGRCWQEDGVVLCYVPLGGGIVPTVARMVGETLALRPDVVHCFKPKAYAGLVAFWLWQFHRHQLRLIVDTDDWEGWGGWNNVAPYPRWQKHFFAWQEQWGLRHNHAVTVASRELWRMAKMAGAQRVVYVPNGPGVVAKAGGQGGKGARRQKSPLLPNSPSPLPFSNGPTLLVYSRLFEFDTGRLVAVLRGAKTAVPDLNILMVGAGLYVEDNARFRRQLDAAGLTASVVDVGWVVPEALPPLLAAAAVGVYLMDNTLLNRTKCPVKLADMVAAGVPVVGEAVGQVGEYVVNGRSGLLRPSGDVAGLTADLAALLTDPARRARLAAAARAHYQVHFRWEDLAARLTAVYQSETLR